MRLVTLELSPKRFTLDFVDLFDELLSYSCLSMRSRVFYDGFPLDESRRAHTMLALSLSPPPLPIYAPLWPPLFFFVVFPLASPPPLLYFFQFPSSAIESILVSLSLSLSLRVWVVRSFLGYREINFDSPSRVEGFI